MLLSKVFFVSVLCAVAVSAVNIDDASTALEPSMISKTEQTANKTNAEVKTIANMFDQQKMIIDTENKIAVDVKEALARLSTQEEKLKELIKSEKVLSSSLETQSREIKVTMKNKGKGKGKGKGKRQEPIVATAVASSGEDLGDCNDYVEGKKSSSGKTTFVPIEECNMNGEDDCALVGKWEINLGGVDRFTVCTWDSNASMCTAVADFCTRGSGNGEGMMQGGR